MSLRFKSSIKFFIASVLGALLLLPAVAVAQEVAPVPVKIGKHEKFTRIVFPFPKLLAYHVTESPGGIRVTFDTKAAAEIEAVKSPHIKKITASPGSDGMLTVDIGTAAGADFKHYRLQRRVVVDVYAAGASRPNITLGAGAAPGTVTPAQQPLPKPEKPAKIAEVKEAPPAVSTPLPPPVWEAPAKTAAEEAQKPKAVLTETPSALSDPMEMAAAKLPGRAAPKTIPTEANLHILTPPQKPVIMEKEVPPLPAVNGDNEDDKGATITLSALTPVKLAVFERFGALWIVTDATAAAQSRPVITGPMASFIRPPKILKFDGGRAYRYTFPRTFYPRVTKQSLAWDVELLPQPPAAVPPPPAGFSTEFDSVSRKAKLVAPLKGAGDALSFEDPEIGDMLFVVPTSQAGQAVRQARRLTDLEIIPAVTGMVLRPLKDGVAVHPVDDQVVVSSPFGLKVTPEGSGAAVLIGPGDAVSDIDNSRLFDFPNWRQGGLEKLQDNKQRLQEKIVAAEAPEDRAGALMELAMLYFSNNFGQETLGILALAQSETPEIEKNPNFMAIRGAANAMSGHYKEALQDLSFPAIQHHPEVNLWIGFAAAASEQWRMADRSFPDSNRLLLQYPDNIAIPFTIYMAESALRLGQTDTAKQLLDSINMMSPAMDTQYFAAVDYLRGEIFSQEGKPDQAIKLWEPVANGLDRLYHTKASLALTRMLLHQKKITPKEAIDRVDSLRFAWRGDGLEVDTLHTLGGLRVRGGQILAGLQDLERAAVLSDGLLTDSAPIRDDMRRIFSDLFVADQASQLSALEAISVYNEFSHLLPPGADGSTARLNFADTLIRVDLLDRAAAIIEGELREGGLPEQTIMALGTKLAAVHLLDARPSQALLALKKTERTGLTDKMREERSLLKARAQSQLNQVSAAITTLSTLRSRNAQRLKADIWWRARNWSEAASAIEALLPDPGKPVSDEEASFVVNAAVAWKLAGNSAKLKEIKSRYETALAGKKIAATFGVVTRESGGSALADRESLLGIAGEVDMFKSFLENYKARTSQGS